MPLTKLSGLKTDPNVSWYDAAAPTPVTRRFLNATPSSLRLMSDSSSLAVHRGVHGQT